MHVGRLLVPGLVALVVALGAPPAVGAAPAQDPSPPAGPALTVIPVAEGLTAPWDLALLPGGSMLVTERPGRILRRATDGRVRQVAADLGDLWVSSETGLMAIEADPLFASNQRFYTCQGTRDDLFSVQVVAWQMDPHLTTAVRVNDPLIGGIDGTTGKHGGCQLRVDPEGYLRVGTGDAGWGTNAQDINSLAGKTLRVDRFTGAPAAGNPFIGIDGDDRIYTYGHRNVQGLALDPLSGDVWSIEHGTTRDDEINLLAAGANYGWNPDGEGDRYDESVPMTFDGATPAAWSSGSPTIAPSAGTFLRGAMWGAWDGALAVSTLRGASVRIFTRTGSTFTEVATPPALFRTFGRLRAAELASDGTLYVTTSNESVGGERILAVRPAGPFGPAVASSNEGRLDLVRPTITTSLGVRALDGDTWGPFADLGGRLTSDADVASWGTGRLDVFGRGTDGAVWHRPASGGGFGAWRTIGGTTTSGPSVTSFMPGHLEVFARGADDALWANQWFVDHWSGWYSLGGRITSDPDVTATGPGRLLVFARGTDDALWYRESSGGSWGPWSLLGGVATSGPGAASSAPGTADVFVRGTDGSLWGNHRAASGWTGWRDLALEITSDPDATSAAPGEMDVVARGTDGAVWQRHRTGGAWADWTLVP